MEIVNLQQDHDRGSFSSNTPLLDNYIKKQASQDVRKDLSACYVIADENRKVFAYYTLSANSIPQEGMPEDLLKKIRLPPSYHDLPAVMLGRLAVDEQYQGKGYGELLLLDALNRCLFAAEQIGTIAVIVDPIDQRATDFYAKYGFHQLQSSKRMFITMQTIRELQGA